jgi:hypothetical protein
MSVLTSTKSAMCLEAMGLAAPAAPVQVAVTWDAKSHGIYDPPAS